MSEKESTTSHSSSDKPANKKAGQKMKLRGANTKWETKKTEAQKRYLLRQNKDVYTKKAQAEGYRSRAAYKLLELDEKYGLLKNAKLVVDLGAAPGGWCQVVLEANPKAKVLALDVLPVEPLENVDFIQGDFTTDETWDDVQAYMEEKPKADLVISDMAPNTIGHASTDHLRSMVLAELAGECAVHLLREGGHFACKFFQGGQEQQWREALRPYFTKIHFAKPPSSRANSRETFLIGVGFKAAGNKRA